jgi:cobalt-zinc-cadmium efflux system outer membrane protein
MLLPVLGAWWAVIAWASPAHAAPLTPDETVRSALERDPSLLAARADVIAAEGALRAATFLRSNPYVSVETSLTSDLSGASLQQPISVSGEGLPARRAARARLDAAELAARRAAFVTAADARWALADAVAAEARARIAERGLKEAGARRTALEARVAAGEAAPLDARLARLEEARAAEALVSARSAVTAARVALARFVPDAASAELPADPLDAVPDPVQEGTRSDLRAAEIRTDAARAELATARAARLPVVSVGAFVERDDGVVSVGPSIGFTLPVWQQNAADTAATTGAVRVADAERDALVSAVSAEQDGAWKTRHIADEALARLHVPAAEDADAALAAVTEAQARGELDTATATLLRSEILNAWASSVDLRRAVAQARLSALLAVEDVALLPPDLREVTP